MSGIMFSFSCVDNSGKRQSFTIKNAVNMQDAIDKGFKKATKNAKGDITTWECKLIRCY